MKAMKQVATPTAIAIGVFFLLSQPTKEFNLDSPLLLYSLAASPLYQRIYEFRAPSVAAGMVKTNNQPTMYVCLPLIFLMECVSP